MSQRQSSNLIIGGGGIGRALAARLLDQESDSEVIVTTRDPEQWRQQATAQGYDQLCRDQRLRLSALDLAQPEHIAEFAASLAQTPRHYRRILVTSGLLHAADQQPERQLEDLQLASLNRSFAINASAPLLVLQALLPQFERRDPIRFAALSARVGSIGDNRLGGWYAYRASKAALNQLIHTAAIELRRRFPDMLCVCLHPGTVDTPLSQPFQRSVPDRQLFSPGKSATCLLRVLDHLTPADSGKFYAWDGRPIEW
ncbi:MAG: SDR family NAD(P)-dependent oxidoreductase [Wenzhouxiangellaceae bacterium]